MIDLRNIKGGIKLIKDILKNSQQGNQPWTKKNQYAKVKKQKNTYTQNTRPKKIF